MIEVGIIEVGMIELGIIEVGTVEVWHKKEEGWYNEGKVGIIEERLV